MIKQYNPRITLSALELRAKAREYHDRGLHELAKSCEKQADYVEKRDRKIK